MQLLSGFYFVTPGLSTSAYYQLLLPTGRGFIETTLQQLLYLHATF